MCQQLFTVNLDEKLNSSKCNLSLEPKIMTFKNYSILCVVGYKGSFGVSQVYFFWKPLDIKLDKRVKHKFSNIMFIKCEIWLGKALFCDPNVFSSSYLPAIINCRLLFAKKNVGEIFFF